MRKGRTTNNYAENFQALKYKKFSRQESVHPCPKPSFRYKGIKNALYEHPQPRLPVRHYRLPPRAKLKNSPFWGVAWSRLVVCHRRFGKPYRSLDWLNLNGPLNYQHMLRNGNGKVHRRTGHEGTEGSRCIALLFLQPRR